MSLTRCMKQKCDGRADLFSTQGIIPPEAAVGGVKQDNSAGGDKKAATFEGVEDSDDEEVDADALKKGELEG